MRTESEEWSGSSWMKRSLNMGRKMCMAATRGWRSSGFLYLFYEGGVDRDQRSPHVLRSGIRSSAAQTPRPPPTRSFWRAGRGRARCLATRRCCLTAGRSRSCPRWSSTCLGSLPWSCDGCTLSAGPCGHQEGPLRAGWGGEKKNPSGSAGTTAVGVVTWCAQVSGWWPPRCCLGWTAGPHPGCY